MTRTENEKDNEDENGRQQEWRWQKMMTRITMTKMENDTKDDRIENDSKDDDDEDDKEKDKDGKWRQGSFFLKHVRKQDEFGFIFYAYPKKVF